MTPSVAVRRRAVRGGRVTFLVAGALLPLSALVAGCILAEPVGELPTLPVSRPTVVQGSVVPATTAVLGAFPDTLIVPVELSDPTLSFEWATFVDFNAFTGEGLVDVPRVSTYEPGTTVGRVRLLTISISPPPDLDRCHVIEVVVALRLVSRFDPKSAHTPDEPGGDIVTWFYSPGGDLSGCPVLDAGLDATIDTGVVAPEGGLP